MESPYKEITQNIEITVTPEFLSNITDFENNNFFWRYFVNIKNNKKSKIQIISRYWKIINEDGSFEEVSGEGVVGETPIIMPKLDFNYSSHVQLHGSSGIMMGHYLVKVAKDKIIEVTIPKFSLDIPNLENKIN